MSKSDSAALQDAATTRRIDPDRIERALTESMTVREHAPAQCLVARDGDGHEEHLVDTDAAACDCEDAHFRNVVCVHMVRASLHHLFAHGADTRLVARVAGAVADLGCPHGNDCDGPCGPGQYPCPACVRSTNTGDWTVYQRLVAREPAAAVDRGEDICTDGGGTVEEALKDLEDATSGAADAGTEPTNLHRDKRPEVKGYGPDVQRDADGSIRRIEVTVKSGTRTSGPPYRELVIAYYVNEGVAHVNHIESGDGDGISRQYLRMLALADDVVGRVPGVKTVEPFEDEIAATRETYERDLRERCAQEGCYDMPDKALESGRCREHTPREEEHR